MTLKILDCTIRDGGHLNGWNFSDSCVRASYYAAVKCGVDYFEVGYRFHEVKPDWGKFAKCDDEYLKNLFEAKPSCKLTVMIDASKGLVEDFKPCKEEFTPVKAIRVATYSYDLDKALSDCERFKELGYETFLNLMVISEFKDEHFNKLKSWKHKDILECVTFADSFGSFVPDDIVHYVKLIKSLGFKNVGFHSHNNLQLAFANSLKAMEEGACCVDASIYGMGRGSGNLPIEIFTGYLTKTGKGNYNPVAYIDVINRFYTDLMIKTPWGYRMESLIGGLKNVHPYYIDDLFRRNLFTINEIWTAAELVKKNCPTSFSTKELTAVLEDKFVHYDDAAVRNQINIMPEADAFMQGKVEYKDLLKGKKVLVIASGPSIKKYQKQIEAFIKKEDCAVIATNFICEGYNPDFHVFAGRKKFLKNSALVSESATIIVPSFFGKELVKINCPKNKLMHFDITTSEDPKSPILEGDTHVCMGVNGAIAGLYIAYQMGAKEIYAAGLDGFGKDGEILDLFYQELKTPEEKKARMIAYEKLGKDLERFNKFMEEKRVPFAIITPTSHDNYYNNLLKGN